MRLQRVGFWVYNFGPVGKDGRTVVDLIRETQALSNVKPRDRRRTVMKVGAGIEAIGWQLPELPGYKLVHRHMTPGHANLCLYVHDRLRLADVDYVRHVETWDRTERPGVHPPRWTMRALLRDEDREETFVFVTHAPPRTPTSGDARAEWVDIMVELLRDSMYPTLMLGDPNGLFDDVKRELGNPRVTIQGTATEAVLARGYGLDGVHTAEDVNGVLMGSDHHRALLGRAVRR